MSISSVVGDLLDALFGSADAAATVAKDAGVSTVDIAGQSISISSLVSALDALSKVDLAGTLSTNDFTNFKSFLLSAQFENDLIPVADLLGVIGLFVPPVAVAANDTRMIAIVLTVIHKIVNLSQQFGWFSNLVNVDGTLVTQSWADDPRHQLNPDGTFKN
jgi:hypothetical protein